MEDRVTHIPDAFVEYLLSQEFTLNPYNSRVIQGVFVNFEALSFTPYMVENALYLIEGRGLPVEVAYDKVLVEFSSFLENNIMD